MTDPVVHAGSVGTDPSGRLFERGDTLLRGIASDYVPVAQHLLASATVRRLLDEGSLVDTHVTDTTIDGFPLVLEHRRLPVVSFASEWPGAMLRDAGLAVLDLDLALLDEGFLVKDTSPWNIVFDGARPVFVDFTNIWPLEWIGYGFPHYRRWFERFYTYPLEMIGRGHARAARLMLRDIDHGVSESDFIRYVPGPAKIARRILRAVHWRVRGPEAAGERSVDEWRALLQEIRRGLVAVAVGDPAPQAAAASPEAVAVVERLRPSSVLQLGTSDTSPARAAAGGGATTVVVGSDEGELTREYLDASRRSIPLTPLALDLRAPTPSYGIGGAQFPAAGARLGAELVVALELYPELTPEAAVETFALFARRHLLVLAREERRAALERRFTVVDRPTPELLLCERR